MVSVSILSELLRARVRDEYDQTPLRPLPVRAFESDPSTRARGVADLSREGILEIVPSLHVTVMP